MFMSTLSEQHGDIPRGRICKGDLFDRHSATRQDVKVPAQCAATGPTGARADVVGIEQERACHAPIIRLKRRSAVERIAAAIGIAQEAGVDAMHLIGCNERADV